MNNSSVIVMDLLFIYLKEMLSHIFKLTLIDVCQHNFHTRPRKASLSNSIMCFSFLQFLPYIKYVFSFHILYQPMPPMRSDLQLVIY